MELSEIALQKLLQLFPEISSYIVNFRDITEESSKEESGLQIGIFILQFGEDYYYIPVIAKNETVLPIDSLFNATTGTFVPLTRSFIDKTISASQVYLGKSTKIPKTVPQNPSVYDMVTPPRTGKFVYASSSRLVEFLGMMPNMVKKAMVEKFSEDKEVYTALHRLFGLENLLEALKPTSAITVRRKPAVEIITDGNGLDNSAIKDILDKGYSLRGENTTNRVAVLANDSSLLGPLHTISGVDVGADYDVVMRSGEVLSLYTPRLIRGGAIRPVLLGGYNNPYPSGSVFGIFANGDYVTSDQIVARGSADMGKKVVKNLFSQIEAWTPRDVTSYSSIALFTADLDLIGAFRVNSVVETPSGITIRGYNMINKTSDVTINAYRNCRVVDASDPTNIFIPVNTLIAKLGDNVTDSLEVNPNAARARLEVNTLSVLGSAMDIGFDGVEFIIAGRPMGTEKTAMEKLVVQEGLNPSQAEFFLKEAQDKGSIKIYLSKKADFEPGEIPQFGELPGEQINNFGADGDGSFSKNLKSSLQTEDPQMVESMVISELLQATDMKPLVKEYLPEIQAAIDKLGRTLFLSRLNMDKLSEAQNSNEVLSFIANLRNVYRLLGDNATKLERMVSGPEEAQEEAGSAK